jgi:HAE1 family hydrophobic/amphiphilic exporter-1
VLDLQDSLRAKLGALTDAGETKVEAGGGGGFSASQIQVIVQADDAKALATATEQVRAAVAGTPDVVDVSSDLASSSPRIDVKVNREEAAKLGLAEATIGQTVSAAFRGAPLGQVTIDGVAQNLLLRIGSAPATLDQVKNLPLPTAAGIITLSRVAEVSQVDGPVQVSRIDGNRSATVTGTATGSNLGATTTELTKRLTALTLPAGASYSLGGASADQSDAFGDLGLALLAAVAIVFLVMAATFRSLIQPLILLVSIPFAATGAIVLLLATGTALGVPALIGMLMLIGIVVTNAIVLMDLINQYREQGMGVQEAVIEGGRRRLRPILMTAIATIFALLPMALGLTGSGGFISQPLAVVVIGGLLSSTALTLVLVPTLYTMVENTRERLRARRARRVGGPGGDVRHSAPEPREPHEVGATA